MPADRLTLEITEDGMVGEPDRPMPTLRRLRELGVRLSVDDFGTGYSSLSYLRRLPVHEVKIDRSFVQGMATDPGDLAIVRAVVDLSRQFGLAVVAEGVESELTLELLEEIGCDIGQGFLFSRPLPYERLEAWFGGPDRAAEPTAGESRRGAAAARGALSRRCTASRGYPISPAGRRRVLLPCASRGDRARPLSSVGRASPW